LLKTDAEDTGLEVVVEDPRTGSVGTSDDSELPDCEFDT
jgi:hypothetical protein